MRQKIDTRTPLANFQRKVLIAVVKPRQIYLLSGKHSSDNVHSSVVLFSTFVLLL